MTYDACIFDLDGTLLNTLSDLVRLTNMVLEEYGWPARSREEILSFVGNGGRVLMGRAAPANVPEALLDEAFARWRALYPTYGHALTRPYEGIPELLASLKEEGMLLGVLSNKFDGATKQVIGDQFPGMFDIVWGERPEVPRKPDPTGLRAMMCELDVAPERVLYVGDSGTDIATAKAAGVVVAAVTWGYGARKTLQDARPDWLVDEVAQLASIARGACAE